MNKLNYLSISVIIILLIGNIFFYSNLNKQNLGIKKDILDIKKAQIDQQTSQKEAIKNLQSLATFNWKEYWNNDFEFNFKYPDYVNICDDTSKLRDTIKAELNLGIRTSYNGIPDSCDTRDVSPTRIIIKKNTDNYKTAKEAFYKEFSNAKLHLNYQLGYFKIAKLDAYGIILNDKYTIDSGPATAKNYEAIILKNDYLVKLSSYSYIGTDSRNRQFGSKPIFDIIISSFYFNTDQFWK